MIFQIATKNKKEDLRKKFIEKFVDTKTEYYINYISNLKEYSDGMCYDGYLWDVLNADYNQIERTMEHAIAFLKSKSKVFVMWDIHSKHKVFDYRIISNKYPKDTIIEIGSLELCQLIQSEWDNDYVADEKYFPEDIYIFDNTMEWYVIFTHEGYDRVTKPDLGETDYIRICFVHDPT